MNPSDGYKYSKLKSGTDTRNLVNDLDRIEDQVTERKRVLFSRASAGNDITPKPILASQYISFDGSIFLPEEYFKQNAPEFFLKSRRATFFRGAYYLRGTRYTISTNPTFELRQKLETLDEDLREGIDCIEGNTTVLFRIAASDYIKNAILTVYNSFLYDEKRGRLNLDDRRYQKLREAGQNLAQASVNLHYKLFCQMPGFKIDMTELKKMLPTFTRLSEDILRRYKEGTFSSRHLTRPEAANPQVVAGAAYAIRGILARTPPQVLIGLPSGSTELALATKLGFNLNFQGVDLLLMPISLHSAKSDFDQYVLDKNSIVRSVRRRKPQLLGKHICIVDDNSSTGRTIDVLHKILDEEVNPSLVTVCVAEADTVRSRLDIYSEDRPYIAKPKTYSFSVNRLPVSKTIAPKIDLKEVAENARTVSCIKQRYISSNLGLIHQLIGEVYIDSIKHRTSSIISKTSQSSIIDSFRRTFLSNFWAVNVHFEDAPYSSVEHAYQAMKFTHTTLSNLPPEHIQKINRALEKRGESITESEIPKLFVDPNLKAGTSKIAANQLRILGYVREDWDYIKLPVMTKLLVQKFANSGLYGLLQDTAPKYLVEGNDWGDTFWGFDNGRGRNFLGRLLMRIRSRPLYELNNALIEEDVFKIGEFLPSSKPAS